MNKRRIFFIILIFFIAFGTRSVRASEAEYIEKEMDALGLDEVDISQEIGDSGELSFKETVMKIISGDFDFSLEGIINGLISIFAGEIIDQTSFIKKIIIIAILSAIIKNLTSSFGEGTVGELGFYICYIVLVILIMAGFSKAVALVSDTTDSIVTVMQSMLPVFISVIFSSGKIYMGAAFYPIILSAAQLISLFIRDGLIPLISVTTILHMVNYISEKSYLTQLTNLLKSIIKWSLKLSAMIFMGVLSLQRIGAPLFGQIFQKGAKVSIESIPVGGDILGGAVEIAAGLTTAVGSGVAAAAIIFLVVIALIPLAKLAVMALIFKVAAAVTEPVSHERIIKCLNGAGDLTFLLIGVIFTVEMMFIFSVIILLSAM